MKLTKAEREAREVGNALNGCGAIVAAMALAVTCCSAVMFLERLAGMPK